MDNKIAILITGAGAPGFFGTIYSLKNNEDSIRFKIVGIDINDQANGKYFCDKFYKVPQPEQKNYLSSLHEILKSEKIKVIIPQTTREIVTLSEKQNEIKKLDVATIVSEAKTIKKANDKYFIIKECEKIGVPYPQYFLVKTKRDFLAASNKLGFPKNKIVVKPRISNGLRGLRIISDEVLSIDRFLNEKPSGLEISLSEIVKIFSSGDFPEIIVQEYLPGKEYTVDVFKNNKGIIVIPRVRKSIRSGISFDTMVELREDIIEYSKKLAYSLNLKYCFGFQFKLDKNNVPKILESNPRVQGTMVTSTFAGFNMIYYAVKEALGKEVSIENVEIVNGVSFKRYWGGIGVDGDNFIGKI
jgi:carbamoyl-phosphate synthase large subunit